MDDIRAHIDGEWLIISGYQGYELDYTYWGIRDGALSAIHSLSFTWTDNDESIIYKRDGITVSSEVFNATLEQWSIGEETYPFNFARESEANDILTKTTEARERLGLTAPTWDEAYHTFIMDGGYLKAGQTYYAGPDDPIYPIRFSLHDLDTDGVPELIVFNGGGSLATATSYVYTYAGGRVVYKGDAGFRYGDLIYALNSRPCLKNKICTKGAGMIG